MASINYPGLTNHALIHKDLLEKYAAHAKQIEADGGVAPEAFFHFLSFWLSAHIKGLDVKYGAAAQKLSA